MLRVRIFFFLTKYLGVLAAMSLVDGRLKKTVLDSFQSFKSLSFVFGNDNKKSCSPRHCCVLYSSAIA